MFDTEQAQEAFLKEYGISHEMVRRSMTTWSGLDEIVSDYTSMKDKYEEIADKYTSAFRKIRQVNSIRSRVKDSEHLVGKIIRKNADRGSDRAYLIDTSNYKKYITDLVGVRVLLLFQNDWEMIHDYILENWGDRLHETPFAYIRENDDDSAYKQRRLNVKRNQSYRSVHYVIEDSAGICIEVQVRTLAEETWAEMNHKLSYPYNIQMKC